MAPIVATDERSFGYLLRRYRLAALVTQEQLAERAHLSYRTISDLERGAKHTPRRDTVLLLADALELSPQERATLIAAAHPVDRVPPSRVCPSCGASLPLTQTFCGECGVPFEPGRPSAAITAPTPAPPPEPHPVSLAPADAPLTTHQAALSPGAAPAEERRLVTALFCDLVGFTPLFDRLDPEEVREIQGAYFSAMSTHITRYGGTVEKYAGDAVLALFGVPTAHEDDPERAVLCALAMQQAIGPLADSVQRQYGVGVAIRVGIDTGEVVAGSWDVTDGQEVAVTGHALNTAARIEAAADPGEVLVGRETMRLTRRRIEYGEERLLTLKGMSQPVPGYPALGIAEQVGERWETIQRATPLIGRERELAQLLELWERVTSGEGQLLTVIGEPGVGKSRLLSEGIEQIKERSTDVRLVRGRCLSYGQNISLWLIADLVRSLVGVREADGPDRVREAVTSTLDDLLNDCDAEDRREAIDVLGEVVGLAAGGSMVAQAGPQVRRAALIRSLRRVLGALTDRAPVVLVLEDLHWIDEASQEVIQDVLVDVPGLRVLVLAAQRQGWQAPWSEWSWTERISLRPLGERDAAMLAGVVLGGHPDGARLAPDLLAYLGDRAGGNPFFVEELVRALQEAGGLQQQDDGISLKRRAAEKLPATLTEVILARLDRLEAQVKAVAQVGSVIGRSFAVRLLAQVMEQNQAALELPLTALQQAELAFPRRSGELEYVFKHVTVQEVAYGMLVQKRRKQLHLQTARAIASLYPSDEYLEMIAYHFNRTDEHAEAARWLESAGDRAADMYANEMALTQYDAARQRVQADTKTLARLDEKEGGVLTTLGRYDDALLVLERAEEMHQAAGDLEGVGRTTARIGWVHAWRGTPREGVTRIEPLLDRLEGAVSGHVRALMYVSVGPLYLLSGAYEEQLMAAENASHLARLAEDDAIMAQAEVQRGIALLMLGHVEVGRQVLLEVLPLAEAVGDLPSLSHSLNNIGYASMIQGEFDQARLFWERTLTVNQRMNNLGGIVFSMFHLGELLSLAGEWPGAWGQFEQARSLAGSAGTSFYSTYPLFMEGRLLLAEGKWRQAGRRLEECVAVARRTSDLHELRVAQTLLAEFDLLEGRPDSALTRLKPILDRPGLEELGVTLLLPVLAWAYLELGDEYQAEAVLTMGVARARRQNARLALVDMLRVRGMLLASQGHWQQAEQALQESISLAHTMPYPYAEGRSLFEYGVLQGKSGDPGRACERLSQALAIFQRLGARKDVERTEEVLGRG